MGALEWSRFGAILIIWRREPATQSLATLRQGCSVKKCFVSEVHRGTRTTQTCGSNLLNSAKRGAPPLIVRSVGRSTHAEIHVAHFFYFFLFPNKPRGSFLTQNRRKKNTGVNSRQFFLHVSCCVPRPHTCGIFHPSRGIFDFSPKIKSVFSRGV